MQRSGFDRVNQMNCKNDSLLMTSSSLFRSFFCWLRFSVSSNCSMHVQGLKHAIYVCPLVIVNAYRFHTKWNVFQLNFSNALLPLFSRIKYRGSDGGIGTYYRRALRCIQMMNDSPYYTRPAPTHGHCKSNLFNVAIMACTNVR